MNNHNNIHHIEDLEKTIQDLYKQYQLLSNAHAGFYELKAKRMQIKQAEESLRLKRRMHIILAD